VFQFLARTLSFFYDIWPSYAGAIILFTLAVMLVLSPLAIKSTRSMIRMQRLQPEMKKLQAKYKDDREALNREMMAFYKANNVNPFSSCLPLLLQMPVFIVLYQVLSGLTKTVDGTFEPKYLDHSSNLYQDLTTENEMMSFGMDLSKSALEELQAGGLLVAIPYILLVGIVVVTSFVQQRQVQGRNPNASANPQQQMIGKILPFVFIPISITLPAGVVIYFAVSNLVRVGQQALVTKLEYSHDQTAAGVRDAESTPKETKAKAKPGDALKPGAGGGKGTDKGRTPPTVGKRSGTDGGNGAGGNGAGGGRNQANGARRAGAPAGSGARSRNRKRKRK
jgi:YidC/Oxa1 family membrane protein insertase